MTILLQNFQSFDLTVISYYTNIVTDFVIMNQTSSLLFDSLNERSLLNFLVYFVLDHSQGVIVVTKPVLKLSLFLQ